jgi:hypothetical protein
MDPMQDVKHSPANTTISVDDSLDFDTFFTSATDATAPESSMVYPNCISGDQRLARNNKAGDSTTHPIPGSGHPNNLESSFANDDLAELEAWLLSGEIEIVPELPW